MSGRELLTTARRIVVKVGSSSLTTAAGGLDADRVDALESHATSLLTMRPDNPITETGVLSEPKHRPIASRRGSRVDRSHSWIDPVLVAGPWVAAGAIGILVVRRLRRRASR